MSIFDHLAIQHRLSLERSEQLFRPNDKGHFEDLNTGIAA
jgi:hypothetical protein